MIVRLLIGAVLKVVTKIAYAIFLIQHGKTKARQKMLSLAVERAKRSYEIEERVRRLSRDELDAKLRHSDE